jgi:MYXO-CTERM domain-containing protein
VDPVSADLVYVRSDEQSQLFVTSNAGMTWSTPLSLGDAMLGFALSSDGSHVYAGSFAAGLFAATRASLNFTQVSSPHVECLASHGSVLWACADEPSGFITGLSSTNGASFVPKLANLLGIGAPIACSAGLCTAFDYDASPPYDPFTALCTNLNACVATASPLPPLTMACMSGGQCSEAPLDAGSTTTRGAAKSSCGCSTVGDRHDATLSALWAPSALLIAASRRRSHPRHLP